MKAFRFPGDREVRIVDTPVPDVGPGEVRIRIRATAICGTDLHLYRQSAEARASMAERCVGHEPVGEVEAVGEGVRAISVGDRVVGYHVGGCGECPACRLRRYKECPRFAEVAMAETRDGANAEYVVLPEGQCLPLPDDVSFEAGAVLACNFGTAYGAVRNAFRFPGGTVAIWGLGPVGLCAVLIAKAVGLRDVAIDVTEGRRRLAGELGADEVLDGCGDDMVGTLQGLTDGRGPDCVIDTTGVQAVQSLLVPSVAVRGTVVLVGIGQDSSVGPVLRTVLKQLTIVGSWIFDIEDWEPMLAFVRQHGIDPMRVVSHVASPDEAKAMYQAADKAEDGKVVFSW